VLFQTFANIVLAATVILFIYQIDRKLEEISGVERLVAKSLAETTEINATLTEILLSLRARDTGSDNSGSQ
jgi:hypothetical protein